MPELETNLSKLEIPASAMLLVVLALAGLPACSDDSNATSAPPFDASVPRDASATIDAARIDATSPIIDVCATTDAASRRLPQVALV